MRRHGHVGQAQRPDAAQRFPRRNGEIGMFSARVRRSVRVGSRPAGIG
jgi:hypothetical protein